MTLLYWKWTVTLIVLSDVSTLPVFRPGRIFKNTTKYKILTTQNTIQTSFPTRWDFQKYNKTQNTKYWQHKIQTTLLTRWDFRRHERKYTQYHKTQNTENTQYKTQTSLPTRWDFEKYYKTQNTENTKYKTQTNLPTRCDFQKHNNKTQNTEKSRLNFQKRKSTCFDWIVFKY